MGEAIDIGPRNDTRRPALAAGLVVIAAVTFVASWALMPLVGSPDLGPILRAVAATRESVYASCVVQLASAAAWAAGLVLLPAPAGGAPRGWWLALASFAVGATGFDAADAIFRLVAYALTSGPGEAAAKAAGLAVVSGLVLPIVAMSAKMAREHRVGRRRKRPPSAGSSEGGAAMNLARPSYVR